MRTITSSEELRRSIQELELERAVKEQLLREQFMDTYESLRFINLLKSSLKKSIGSSAEVTDIAGMALGMASGYISKKIFIGTSGNPFRKLMGSVLQLGVMSYVSKHPYGLKSRGEFLFNQILRKRE